jgi:hypothetical protein
MRLLFFLVFIGSGFGSFGQNIIQSSTTTERTFTGTIGPYQVRLNLSFTDDKVSGEYTYSKESPVIQLNGILENNVLSLKETYSALIWGKHDSDDENLFKGMMTVHFDGRENITGSVKAISGKKDPYQVSLHKIFEAVYIDSTLRLDYKNTNPDLKIQKIYSLEMKEVQFSGLPDVKKQKDLNSLYRYHVISYADKNHLKSLDDIPPKKLAEFGLPDGNNILAKSAKIKNPGFPYSYSNAYSVKYLDNRVMSVENAVVEYNGAPHEFSQLTYDNINVETGNGINLDSVLIKGGRYILDSMGDFCFRQQMNLGPDADFWTAGYRFKYNLFHAGTNFYFTMNGLCFVFNKYEITSYNAGIIQVVIPYSMIKSIIRSDGALGWVLEN